jgi:hypothetical protein
VTSMHYSLPPLPCISCCNARYAGRDAAPRDMASISKSEEVNTCGGPQSYMWAPMTREIPSDRPGSTHYFTYFSYNNYRRARSCAKYMNDNELRRPHRTDLHCDNPVAVAVASACAGYFTVTARGSQAGSRAADGVCGVTVRTPCRVGAGLVGLVGLSGLVVGEPLAAYICGTQ